MGKIAEFSKPVVVDEGIAFCVQLSDGRKQVAVATKERLGVGRDAPGITLLAAFSKASGALCAEAEHLVRSATTNPVYLGRK